mgnify:CR=1 FL=1
MKKEKGNLFYAISLGLELGFLIAIPLVLFLVIGVFLDNKFNVFPFLTLAGIFLGILATFFDIYYLVLPFLKKKVVYKKGDNNHNNQ